MTRMHRMQLSGIDRPRVKARVAELGLPISGYLRALVEKDVDMQASGELNDLNDPPDLNTGTPWSDLEAADLEWGAKHDHSAEEIATFLCRTMREVAGKAAELGYPNLPLYRARRG